MALLLASISKKKQIRSAKLSQNIHLGHVYAFLVQQMTMTIRLLATGCFVCAQVKVEHPVIPFKKLHKYILITAIVILIITKNNYSFLIIN